MLMLGILAQSLTRAISRILIEFLLDKTYLE
jgi:hypothetical protein